MLSILGKRNLMAGADGFTYISLNTSYDLPLPIKKSKKQVKSPLSLTTPNNLSANIETGSDQALSLALQSTEPPSSHLNCYSNL